MDIVKEFKDMLNEKKDDSSFDLTYFKKPMMEALIELAEKIEKLEKTKQDIPKETEPIGSGAFGF